MHALIFDKSKKQVTLETVPRPKLGNRFTFKKYRNFLEWISSYEFHKLNKKMPWKLMMTMSLSKWWAVVSAERMFIFFMVISGKKVKLPSRFRKAGRVWCDGARETYWVTCRNGVTPCKTKEFLKSPWFFRS